MAQAVKIDGDKGEFVPGAIVTDSDGTAHLVVDGKGERPTLIELGRVHESWSPLTVLVPAPKPAPAPAPPGK